MEQRQGDRRKVNRPEYGPGGTRVDRRGGDRREPLSRAQTIVALQETILDLQRLQVVTARLLQQRGHSAEFTANLSRTQESAGQEESRVRAELAALVAAMVGPDDKNQPHQNIFLIESIP